MSLTFWHKKIRHVWISLGGFQPLENQERKKGLGKKLSSKLQDQDQGTHISFTHQVLSIIVLSYNWYQSKAVVFQI